MYRPKVVIGTVVGTGYPIDGHVLYFSQWDYDNCESWHLHNWSDDDDEAVMLTMYQSEQEAGICGFDTLEDFAKAWKAKEWEAQGSFCLDLDKVEVLSVYQEESNETDNSESLKPQWIPVTERLPKISKQYLVTVAEVRWPKSTYDSIDSPTERSFVCAMYFDCTNKLWHKDDGFVLNALVDPDDILDGYFAVAWMPLPEPYNPVGGK